MLDAVIEKITQQQAGKENTTVFMCGEQLKDICRQSPEYAELVLKDLDDPEMTIEKAEEKIHEYSDKNKPKGAKSFGVPPDVAENIIREFYGLGAAQKTDSGAGNIINLSDFL